MKSIKPGRGPSKRGAAGSVFGIAFGVLWTVLAVGITAGAGPIGLIFPLFGLLFIGVNVYNLMYHKRNAEAEPEDRDSLLEIVDSDDTSAPATDAAYCPWCGEKLGEDYQYCPKCGRKLP
ncbi:MAG: zinc ribbon domain-containing protein [Clostridia bacterium]|nr:zinc ribbon domain-containing protein [Clostridia bacterium]